MSSAGGQSASFTVILWAQVDIPCAEGVDVTVFGDNSSPAGLILGCETADRPFDHIVW